MHCVIFHNACFAMPQFVLTQKFLMKQGKNTRGGNGGKSPLKTNRKGVNLTLVFKL